MTSVCLQTWQSKQPGSSGHQKQSQLSKLLQQWINRMPATTIDTITYHARPLGYVREWELCKQFFEVFPEYDFPKRYDPYKRYRRIKDLPEFKAYKKKQLAHRFSQAMTILEL